MALVILAVYLILFLAIIVQSKFFSIRFFSKKWVVGLFLVKILFGCAFYGVYEFYYAGDYDSKSTFSSSVELYNLSKTNPRMFANLMLGKNDAATLAAGKRVNQSWQRAYEQNVINENRTVLRVNALLNFLSFHYYPVHLLMMCFFAFCGSFFLYHFFSPQTKTENYIAIGALFLLPTALFWTSGILKEPLFFLAMSGFLFFLQRSLQTYKMPNVICAVLFAVMMLYTRVYFAIVMMLLAIVYVICHFWQGKEWKKYGFVMIVGLWIVVTLNLFYAGSSFDVIGMLTNKNHNFIAVETQLFDGLDMQVPHLDGTISSFFINAPRAIYNAIMAPKPVSTWFEGYVFAENLFLALLLLTTVLFLCLKKVKMDNKMIFLFCFCMVVLLLIGYTTPNAGAVCRYKSVILPVWTYILLAPLANMRKEQQEGIAGNGETGE